MSPIKPHSDLSHLWILIADGKRAQAYQLAANGRRIPLATESKRIYAEEQSEMTLEPVDGAIWEAASPANYDEGGRLQMKTPGNTGIQPRLDAREEVKCNLMRGVAEDLDRYCRFGRFNQLIIAAPPKMLGEIKRHLSKQLQDSLVATLAKDLTHQSGAMLLMHFSTLLPTLRANQAA